jgi:hypothetical protein
VLKIHGPQKKQQEGRRKSTMRNLTISAFLLTFPVALHFFENPGRLLTAGFETISSTVGRTGRTKSLHQQRRWQHVSTLYRISLGWLYQPGWDGRNMQHACSENQKTRDRLGDPGTDEKIKHPKWIRSWWGPAVNTCSVIKPYVSNKVEKC